MRMPNIFSGSNTVRAINSARRFWGSFAEAAVNYARSSYINSLTGRIVLVFRTAWENSSIVRSLDLDGRGMTMAENSVFIRAVLAAWDRTLRTMKAASEWSVTVRVSQGAAKDIGDRFLRKIGIVVVIAVTTESILILLCNREMDVPGWCIRAAFFAEGILAILCGADLEQVKEGSFVLRKLRLFGMNER
ncbi:MAG: hypothetical protein HQL30_06925 [Candidatus Omnitrophica bacterium]|nr:hypothetical protein [Candidatus Omnitrophota bacterium]